MTAKPKSGEIRKFIISNVEEHPSEIAKITAEHFGITRQAVSRHLATLIDDEILEADGKTKKRTYSLKSHYFSVTLSLAEHNQEDIVWRDIVSPHFEGLSDHNRSIWYYGFTEMYNNAIDHSEGTNVRVYVNRNAINITLGIHDDGIGIFEKIKTRFDLIDHRHAILELLKGKLTTDPRNHSGQGIFFTSRIFDYFTIESDGQFFSHRQDLKDDWLLDTGDEPEKGTRVVMEIAIDSPRTTKEIFDQYSNLDSGEYEFSKTKVPLRLAQFGKDGLVSRSQAKRVLARCEAFEEVILDFDGIDSIGQAFADEIFRVFASQHPDVRISAWGTNQDVRNMIERAKTQLAEDRKNSGNNSTGRGS
ncbi:STAS-like domain-containing protein [Singulisphaera sp. PoT]|uniref:STAS-like domain-containing protein n=1 Tax=Singulisphaera sp. PoT TaxID=3411797 RepID=UPI003BF5F7AB